MMSGVTAVNQRERRGQAFVSQSRHDVFWERREESRVNRNCHNLIETLHSKLKFGTFLRGYFVSNSEQC